MHGPSVHIDDEVLGKAYDTRLVLRLFGYLRPYLGLVLLSALLLLGYTGTQLLGPYLVKIAIDRYIAARDLVGLDRLWRRQRVYALWLGVALVFLLLWNTKWPHYVLILTAPLCLAAAEGTQRLSALALDGWRRLRAGA